MRETDSDTGQQPGNEDRPLRQGGIEEHRQGRKTDHAHAGTNFGKAHASILKLRLNESTARP